MAINQFETDTDAEIKLIQSLALKAGADFAVPSNHWAKGGAGAVELASSVVKAVKLAPLEQQKYLYDVNDTVENKLLAITTKMYGASGIELSPLAKSK